MKTLATRRFITHALILSLLAGPMSLAPSPAFGVVRPGPRPPAPGNGGGGGGGRPAPYPDPTATPRPEPTRPPRPEPTYTPGPDPYPEPTYTPVPEPIYTDGAYREGLNDGYQAGEDEGREAGARQGRNEGQERGRSEGYEACDREEGARQYEIGYAEGLSDGEREGASEGRQQGRDQGRAQGESEGRADGLARADRDAESEATEPGAAQGYAEAERANAATKGRADGLVAGEQEARDKALQEDFVRGIEEYRREREAQPIQNRDEFSQLAGNAAAGEPAAAGVAATRELGAGSLGLLYVRPGRRYDHPEQRAAYDRGFAEGYRDGYDRAYRATYEDGFRSGYERSYAEGCSEARGRNHREDRDRGFREGHDRGYRGAYDNAYQRAHGEAYDAAFGPASEGAYRANYREAYDRHFELARARAYRERFAEIYGAAYEPARAARFAELYPRFAKTEYERGRTEEAKAFEERPLRLLSSEVIDPDDNGLFEPGEPLRLRLELRNFATRVAPGKTVLLRLEALDAASAVISRGETTLARDLRENSVTRISEALEFRMNEGAVGRPHAFRLTVMHQGRKAGETTMSVEPSFAVRLELAETPELRNGLPSPVRVRVTNLAARATGSALKVRLAADTAELEVQEPERVIPPLNEGEARIVEFSVIGRSAASEIRLPLALAVTQASDGRRLGLLDLSQEAPVAPIVNDYRLEVLSDLKSLREPGVTRVSYRISNRGSRLLFGTLALSVRVLDSAGRPDDSFAVIGPNPQLIQSLEKGESLTFVVPLLARTRGAGDLLELELREDGQPVVIHRSEFR